MFTALLFAFTTSFTCADIFVSSSFGADSNSGDTPAAPFASLAYAASAAAGLRNAAIRLRRGDSWFLPFGVAFGGLVNASITDYATDGSLSRPRLIRAPPAQGAALSLANSLHTAVIGLEIVGGEYGIALEFGAPFSPMGTPWENLTVADCFFNGIVGGTYNPTDSTGWGAAVALATAGAAGAPASLTRLVLAHNVVNGSDTAYRNYVYFGNTNPVVVAGLVVDSNAIVGASFNALFLDLTSQVLVTRNVFLRDAPNRDFTGGTTDIIMGTLDPGSQIVDNEITGRGEWAGEPDGCGADFETNATGVLFARNFISRSFGAGIMIFGHVPRSNRGLRLLNNTLLHNGCGQTVSPDRGSFAFTSLASSGTIAGNVVASCPGVPVFQDGADKGLPEWSIWGNQINGGNATLALAAPPIFTATPAADGGLLLTATAATPGTRLRFTTNGSVPLLSSSPWPAAGLSLPPGFRALAVFVKAFWDAGAVPPGAVGVESESAGGVFA